MIWVLFCPVTELLFLQDYLTDIHNHHERLFDAIDNECWKYLKPPMAKVVVIDANQSLEDVCRQIDKHISSTIIWKLYFFAQKY